MATVVFNKPIAIDLAYKPGSSTTLYVAVGDLAQQVPESVQVSPMLTPLRPRLHFLQYRNSISGYSRKIQIGSNAVRSKRGYGHR